MDQGSELAERIGRFLLPPVGEGFEALALEAFAFQWRRIAPYRRLCEARGISPGRIASWREVPAVPTEAFRTLRLEAAPAREVFRTSGTAGAGRGIHYHPFPELYRRVIDASFPTFCLGAGERPPMLSLVPARRLLPDSSLSFMVEHVLERYGAEDSTVAFGESGVDLEAAASWCERRRRDGRPGFVLATAFALLEWLDALAEAGRALPLPAGSAVFETGGFKGRTREVGREELLTLIERRLGVPPGRVVREYGMTELTSQLYSRSLTGGDPELLAAPHWVRVRVLDPATLEEAPAGEVGIVCLFDLANLGSAIHLLTQDLGSLEEGGLRLLGRASGAELRGCSLTVEEWIEQAR